LLQFEVERIIIYSDKFHDLSTDSNPKVDTMLSPISLAAWNAAYSNSEFIGAADPVLIGDLAACYVLLERLNAAVENYKLFVQLQPSLLFQILENVFVGGVPTFFPPKIPAKKRVFRDARAS